MSTRRPNKSPRGPIERDVLYPMQDFRRRTGFGDKAWTDLRKNGLRIVYVSRRPFVYGGDFIDFVMEHGSDDPLCREPGSG